MARTRPTNAERRCEQYVELSLDGLPPDTLRAIAARPDGEGDGDRSTLDAVHLRMRCDFDVGHPGDHGLLLHLDTPDGVTRYAVSIDWRRA